MSSVSAPARPRKARAPRRPSAPAPAPASPPAPPRPPRRPAGPPAPPADRLPEGWQPGGAAPAPAARPAGSFAAGFRSAIAAEIRRLGGEVMPEPEAHLCAWCGLEFDPAVSRDPHFCASCAAEGGMR
jgi:hypothetical protein